MKEILISDIKPFLKTRFFIILILILTVFGVFSGTAARFSLSTGLTYDSPYQIGYIIAFLSLTTLFFSTLFTAQLSLREYDHNFDAIYFSLPINKNTFLKSRFLAVLILSFSCTVFLTLCFFIGREMRMGNEFSAGFSIINYFVPLICFTLLNTFFVVTIVSAIAWITKGKIQIYLAGLTLYIAYMVTMIFSGSPFIANQLPQSKQAQRISAILDPFGLSAYFHQTGSLTITQKNEEIIPFNGIFLANRVGVLLFSVLVLMIVSRYFNVGRRRFSGNQKLAGTELVKSIVFRFVQTGFGWKFKLRSLLSTIRINLTYIGKAIPFSVLTVVLVFALGMEFYSEIEKGIRIPQKYASSGLMLSTIIQNFHVLGAIIIVFYSNDLFWRARASNFHLIESSTLFGRLKLWSIFLVLVGICVFFTSLLIVEGIVFQLIYQYPFIEWQVYAKLFLFTTAPLILIAGLSLAIHKLIPNRYISLICSAIVTVILTTSMGKLLFKHPVFGVLNSIKIDYSNMNGFGSYESEFTSKLVFASLFVVCLLFVALQSRKSIRKWYVPVGFMVLMVLTLLAENNWMSDYDKKTRNEQIMESVMYEKSFRKYQNTPQPTIVKVYTEIDLYPKKNSYSLRGRYIIANKTSNPINQLLINLPEGFVVNKAVLIHNQEQILVKDNVQLLHLRNPLLVSDTAFFEFDFNYQWKPVNGHQSFNSIIENGSFLRVSRYFPQFGYLSDKELDDSSVRKVNGLAEATAITPLDFPIVEDRDYIELDMIISTEQDQTAIGIGELSKAWKNSDRSYFHYKAENIPFRFGLSSARYHVKKATYRGKSFEVYYHPSHSENVEHVLKNAQTTMEYCEANFGPYPFKTIRFAEVASFTQGFSATAYPASIFMTEQMAFHSNINADKKQDVINELAGHELSHLWWGNNQIDPSQRQGAVMLTETLAMYTELMLIKKMYGKAKAEESVAVHQQIFESTVGFEGDSPLIMATADKPHISYSKGAVMMYRLSEMIGEEKVNTALRNFLKKYSHPNPKPISTDFLKELIMESDIKYHEAIRDLFLK